MDLTTDRLHAHGGYDATHADQTRTASCLLDAARYGKGRRHRQASNKFLHHCWKRNRYNAKRFSGAEIANKLVADGVTRRHPGPPPEAFCTRCGATMVKEIVRSSPSPHGRCEPNRPHDRDLHPFMIPSRTAKGLRRRLVERGP